MALPASLALDAAGRRLRLSPRDPAFVQDPYGTYRAVRTACPVFFWEDYGHWCCAEAATVDALFRDRRFGREAPGGAPPVPDHVKPFYDLDALSMLEREPPAHTRLRRLVNRAFVSRAIARLRPRVASLSERLAGALAGARPVVDLLPAFAEPIPVTIIAELLGVPAEDAPHLLAWSHRMVAMYRPSRSRAEEDGAVAATLDFSAYLGAHLAARRAAPREDLLTVLATAGDDISEAEAVANAALLLNAGHEATVHAIGNAVAAILASGRDPAALFGTPERTAATVEELLRFDPPLHLFTRTALEPSRVGDLARRRPRARARRPDRPPHRGRQPRPRALAGSGPLRPGPGPGPASRLRGRPPLLPRRPPGAARARRKPAGALPPLAGPPPRRAAALCRPLPLPGARGLAGGDGLTGLSSGRCRRPR